jgi:hypothetical protein
LDAWKGLSGGLRRPFQTHTPFQQALRRRILDALEDPSETSINIEELARQFRIPLDVADDEYTELQSAAKAAKLAMSRSPGKPSIPY